MLEGSLYLISRTNCENVYFGYYAGALKNKIIHCSFFCNLYGWQACYGDSNQELGGSETESDNKALKLCMTRHKISSIWIYFAF